MPRRAPAPRVRVLGPVLGLAILVMTGCAPSASPTPSPSTPPTAPSTAAPTESPTPQGPAFLPEGSATDNLPLFTAVTEHVWATEDRAHGRAYVDALVAAGFDKAAMQVTADETTVGNPVESLQFSVRWGDEECLIGQVGPSTGEPLAVVADQLAEGRCLIGETRAIDW